MSHFILVHELYWQNELLSDHGSDIYLIFVVASNVYDTPVYWMHCELQDCF